MIMAAPRYLMENPAEAMRLERKTNARLTRRLLRLVSLRKGQSVLDAGTGTGAVARVMAEMVGPSGTVLAVDRSLERVRHGRGLATPSPNGLTFLLGDIYDLPLADSSVDVAWCRFVFEYLSEPRKALAELIRVTRPGGKVVVGDLDGNGVFHYPLPDSLAAASQKLEAALKGRFDPFAGRKLYSLFSGAGLTNIRVRIMPYNVYAGVAPPDAVANWEQKFATIAPVGEKALGADGYRKMVKEFMDLLRRGDTLSYSLLFLVEGIRP